MFVIDPDIQIWVTLFFVVGAIGLYYMSSRVEKLPMEHVSIGLIGVLLLFFQIFPVHGLDAQRILAGFSNEALITVMALLVVGQGLMNTRALTHAARWFFRLAGVQPKQGTVVEDPRLVREVPTAGIFPDLRDKIVRLILYGQLELILILVLIFVLVISAFLNNTPVVVLFIPIMQSLSDRFGKSASSMMMPLSFVAILGGMTTLIGSSTNLLVNSSLTNLGETRFEFFDFTEPGLFLAIVGLIYVLFVMPRILPDRTTDQLANTLIDESGKASGKQFIAQVPVLEDSNLVGEEPAAGIFPSLSDMTMLQILRGNHAFMRPFDDNFALRSGDVLVLAGTRKALTDAQHVIDAAGEQAKELGLGEGGQVLAEVMVTPASRLIGQNLEQIGFRYRFNSVVLGVQRRSRMIRTRMTDIHLEAGDVLLIQGGSEAVQALSTHRDLLLIEGSAKDLPVSNLAWCASLIFLSVVGLAASGIIPIVVSALLGAAAMIFTGALNIRQAARAVDRNLALMVVAALALGSAMQATGAAVFLAEGVSSIPSHPAVVLSVFFLLVAMVSNVISNNACAVLFTPIAVTIATSLHMDPKVFAVAVVFAANCSFATPIGYQTNLMVMGPGHYRFADFVRAGLPLTLILWLAFSLFAPWYYNL
ncbi:MAG: SLC13 family permease [Alphaproteobacteria bacterium]|jgi:di/tricarboxylate transporter|nr:SLC13 family permease [Alphaproteobacteria bacterium]MDP7182998.1 SLC13 family permease [Alphaproteobacteria bacterium]MDP7191508.1 SLC13 family permease [Alphaproteobacteria bacterium]HJO88869.1 SLC13 family permease [Alphaproteobacteria bacterium]